MKVGIIGCGGISIHHINANKKLGHQLFFVDTNQELAKSLAESHQGEFGTFDDALKVCDSLHILTPANLHFEMIERAMSKNIHVYSEKPLVLNSHEGRKLLEKQAHSTSKVGVNFNLIYHSAVEKMKELLKCEEIRMILGSYQQEFHVLPCENSWRYNETLGGKMRAVTEIGSHFFHLVDFLTGVKITSLKSDLLNFNPLRSLKNNTHLPYDGSNPFKVNSEDSAFVTYKFDGGMGQVLLSEVTPGRQNRLEIEIITKNLSVKWNSENFTSFELGRKGKLEILNFPFSGGFDSTFEKGIMEFYKNIKTNEGKITTLEKACENVFLLEKIYESGKSNSQVEV